MSEVIDIVKAQYVNLKNRGTRISNSLDRGGSSREFYLAITVSILAAVGTEVSQPLRQLTITAGTIGVAYGVETVAVLWFSGVTKGKRENAYGSWSIPLKVVSLVLISVLVLQNNTNQQQSLTRFLVFLSLAIGVLAIIPIVILSSEPNKTQLKLSEKFWFALVSVIYFIFIFLGTIQVAPQFSVRNVTITVTVLTIGTFLYSLGLLSNGLLE